MKHNSKLNRSRWLLLTLFTLIVGISPAWGDSEDFESLTVDGTTLSNGWFVQGGTLKSSVTSITSKSSWDNAGNSNYEMITQGANGTSKSICNYESGNTNKYLIIPVEVTGKIKYYAGGCRTSGTRYVKVYRVTYDSGNKTYSIGAQIGSAAWPAARGSSDAAPNWLANKQEVDLGDDHSMVAFLLQGSAIDEVEYEVYVSTPYVAPASISVVPSGNSAIITWTAGATEETVTAWNLEYKKSSDDVWSEVHGIAAGTLSQEISGLNDNTNYDVRVKAIYGTEESVWKTTTFKTAKVATPATGFTDNFETDKGWELINGTCPNKWVIGTGTNNGGTKSLYISKDGTSYASSSYDKSSLVYASKLFHFEAGDYTVSYDWKCNGESTYDFLRVALVPSNVELTASTSYTSLGSGSTLPTGWDRWLDGGSYLGGSTNWATKSVDITIAEAGDYQVVFAWRNDYSGGNTPAAIDNFKILGAAPVLELGGDVTGTTLAFGSVAETTNKTITITNVGKVAMENITLTETADEDNAFAYAALPKTTLAVDESMDVQATFSGSSAKDYTGTFRVAADDCDPIDVTVTATYSNSPATMAVTLDEEAVGASVAFGSVGKQAQKTFTVTNSGDQTLHITSIASNNTTDFTVSPATLEIAGHSSETFTVTFVYDAEALDAEKTANITVTASNEGIEAKSFTVTGTRIEQWSEDFSGGTLPDGWDLSANGAFTFTDGTVLGHYSTSGTLTTPLLKVESSTEELSFNYKRSNAAILIKKQKNGGDWENLVRIPTGSGYETDSEWQTYTITGLEAGNYKFQFTNDDYYLDNFVGFKRNLNDPKMGIYTDAECTVAATTAETKDFGFATTDQTVSYYIKNDGTGTMTLSKGDNPAGFTATLDKTSVAAGEHATLTITMPVADNGGYHSGNVVVTATDLGAFTVAAQGIVVEDGKLNLNFATDNIPSTWTANDWMKDNGGFIKTGQYGYSNTSMETSTLTAAAGEQLVIVAKNGSSSNSYTFGVKYKKVDAEEWSDLIASANIGTSWTTLVGTIAEAGDYLFQINGYYASIQRIYGLSEPSEPVMVVYDGESLAGASYDFGNVSNEADATWTLTVKNEGKAKITGLAAALSGTNAAHYAVTITGATGEGNDEIEADAQATITVKQLKDNLGSHEATLTISADDPIEDKVIALSGSTRDHTKLYVDFDNPNAMPEGWTIGSNWNIYTYGTDRYAYQSNTSTASSLITTPLTVAADETLKFQAAKYYSNSSYTDLKVRYTTNGGITWNEVNKTPSSTAFEDFELTGVPSGTVVVDFYGKYVKLDNLYGFTPTTAPILSLTESAVAVASGSTKEFGNLTEAGTATYTLSNTGTANLVSTVATTGVATAAISGEGEGVTISKNTVTLEPGKSATITLTLPYEAPYGEKSGAMTISSEGWVADMVVNYTATTIDPTALYVDFNDNTKPAGWYQQTSGWIINTGRAHVYTGVAKALVTEQYAAEEGKNVLRFDAKLQDNNADGELKVYTSTDRKTWTLAKTVTLTNEDQQVALDALADGNYYVKFESTNASIDNLTGLKTILPAPEHDLYVSASNIPTATKVPKTSITATATVYSLRADEEGVYAKLFFNEELVATAEAQDINKDGSVNFELTGNVPATENTYAAKIVVYYSNHEVAFETATTDVEVAHTRTLNIASFTRTDGEDALDADENNQISPSFSVTVENTGSTAATPTVKIYQNGNVVATATAAAPVAAGATSEPIALTATDMSAGEGGELAFTAKAFWTAEDPEAKATSASDVVITVNAAAPKFVLNIKGGAEVSDGDNVEFGLVKEATTKTYTITNSGTAPLELISIVAPTGYTATEVTAGNKTIAIDGTLDIDVTLNAEQGKKSGNLVFTYKVDAMTNNTFTLALSGRSVAADTWTEAFDDYQASIPANWTNNKWSIAGEYNDYPGAVYSNDNDATLISPRLTAEAGEELTFDVKNNYYNTATYAIFSASSNTWSDEETISGTGEITFTAPAAGDYYLRLTGRGAYIQNFVGFKLATTVPVTISQYGYTTFASMSNINADELPDGVEVFYVKSVGGSYVHLTKAEGNIPAGTGLILKGTANEEYDLNIATGATTALEGNLMVGCLENTELGIDASSYVLMNNTEEERAEFQSLAEYGITILAGKAYLKVPGAGAGARLMIFDDGETTGISSVLRQQARDGRVYNLNGQRVENPKKGQLYIINGKQTVVK